MPVNRRLFSRKWLNEWKREFVFTWTNKSGTGIKIYFDAKMQHKDNRSMNESAYAWLHVNVNISGIFIFISRGKNFLE